MSYHGRIYKLAKKDEEFQADLVSTGQKFPRFTFDELEKGVWAAAYSGWFMGKHGSERWLERKAMGGL